METVEGEEVLLEVDEDRAETRALELDTGAGLWTARERFYIGDTEHMACVASDRRGGKQVGFWLLGLSQVFLRSLSRISLRSL